MCLSKLVYFSRLALLKNAYWWEWVWESGTVVSAENGNENCVVMEMGGNEMGETTGMGGNGNSKSNSHNL